MPGASPIGIRCLQHCVESGPVFYSTGRPKFFIDMVTKHDIFVIMIGPPPLQIMYPCVRVHVFAPSPAH